MEGRFRNLNRGEFYVYCPDGSKAGFDTIQIADNRFRYETEVSGPTTFVLVFPNYSEQVVFGQAGSKVTVKGDATHLKEMDITGTKENELMTKLRHRLNGLTPPKQLEAIEEFVRQHPKTLCSIYLVRRHFVLGQQPDYAKAAQLVSLMLKENPDNGQLIMLDRELRRLKNGSIGSQLPTFKATATDGTVLTHNDLRRKVNVVTAWATWQYNSIDQQRRLKRLRKDHPKELAVIGICIDADQQTCRAQVERDSLRVPTVCDGLTWQTPLMQQMGFATVPANLIADQNGRIIARNLPPSDLELRVEQLLK